MAFQVAASTEHAAAGATVASSRGCLGWSTGNGTPLRTVLGCTVPSTCWYRWLNRRNVIHNDVPPPLAWTMRGTRGRQFSEENTLGQPVIFHPCHVSKPAQTSLPYDVTNVLRHSKGLWKRYGRKHTHTHTHTYTHTLVLVTHCQNWVTPGEGRETQKESWKDDSIGY